MPLTDKDIQDWIEMWKVEFGEILTEDQARSEAERVLDFFLELHKAFPHGIDEHIKRNS